jgi:hypothetical protein
VEGIYLQAAKRLRGQTAAKPSNIEYEFILRHYTVNGGTTTQVKESETRGHIGGGRNRWRLADSVREDFQEVPDDKDLGVSRYTYELAPGMSPLSGGYFEHRECAIRRGMERHPRLRPLFEYEAQYTNSRGYWMSFSSAAIALRGECSPKTTNNLTVA